MNTKKIGPKLLSYLVLTLLVVSALAIIVPAKAVVYYSVTFNDSAGGLIFWKYGTNTNFDLPNPDQIYASGTYALPAGAIMIDAKPNTGYVFDHFHYTAGATTGDCWAGTSRDCNDGTLDKGSATSALGVIASVGNCGIASVVG